MFPVQHAAKTARSVTTLDRHIRALDNWIWACALGLLLTVGIWAYGVFAERSSLLFVLVLSLPLAGFMSMLEARAHRLRINRELLLARDDDRAPFLASRSVSDPDLTIEEPTLEEGCSSHGATLLPELAGAIAEYGRLVTIGREIPGWDGISRTGGSAPGVNFVAFDMPDPVWRDLFLWAARCAQTIFVLPGVTTGAALEIRLLEANDWLSKTIVIMPPTPKRLAGCSWTWFGSRWDMSTKGSNVTSRRWPPYDPRGLLYRPNPDFSINKSEVLDYQWTAGSIQRALAGLGVTAPNAAPEASMGQLATLAERMKAGSD